MKNKRLSSAVCALTFLFIYPATVNSALFSVSFTDLDGPQWSGLLDTTTDAVSINSWIENPGGTDFWTPATLPLTLIAVDGSGLYDVPDNWNGIIDNTWGFLSTAPLSNITFNEGLYPDIGTAPGWGATLDGGSLSVEQNAFQLVNWPFAYGVSSQAIADTIVISAVPIPPALWLFGSGLLGLIGIFRRNKTA